MGTGDQEARYSINLDGNVGEVSEETAKSLEGLRAQLEGSINKIRDMSTASSRLVGKTEEVRAAKAQLKAAIEAEKEKLTAGSLAMLKQGTSYDKLAARTKKLAAEQDKLAKGSTKSVAEALKGAGGPVGSLVSSFESLKEVAGSAGGKMALVAGGFASVIAAAAAFAVGIGAATIALGKFILESADLARSRGLTREAITGSAEDAERLGSQIDALAMKVPMAKGAINDLAVALRKNRLGGQELVDTLNAVAQASSGLGEDAGAKVREIVERSRMSGRLSLSPQELLGTGIDSGGIENALAKKMKISVAAARAALFEGRVPLAAGAAAIREAIEKQVGGINLRQMFSLENISNKANEALQALTKNVKIDSLLEKLGTMVHLLDDTTVSGRTLKALTTVIGNGLVGALERGLPIATAFFKGMVLGGLELYILFLKLRNSLKGVFGDSSFLENFDAVNFAMKAGAVTVAALGGALVALGVTFAVAAALFVAPLLIIAAAVYGLWDLITETKWSELGSLIIDGLVGGITTGIGQIKRAIVSVARSIKGAFTGEMEIRSPSKVFAEYGEFTAEGYAQGVEGGAPMAQRAIESMVEVPSGARGGGPGAGSEGRPIALEVHIHAGGAAPGVAKELSDDAFLAKLVKALSDALTGAGIPIDTVHA